jgi:hypothetical protein
MDSVFKMVCFCKLVKSAKFTDDTARIYLADFGKLAGLYFSKSACVLA